MPLYGRYYGPFNPLYHGNAYDDLDAIAQRHDYGYHHMGKRSYFLYNKYDKQMLDEMSKLDKTGWSAKKRAAYYAGKGYFSAKRFYAPHDQKDYTPVEVPFKSGMVRPTYAMSDPGVGRDFFRGKRQRRMGMSAASSTQFSTVSNSFKAPKTIYPKKRKSRRGRPISKRVKKYVKYAKIHNDWQLVRSQTTSDFKPITSAVNKVDWSNQFLPLASTYFGRMVYNTILDDGLGADELATRDVNDTIGAFQGKSWKYEDNFKYWLKNNANGQANLVVYQFKCIEGTDFAPIVSMEQSRDAKYSESTTSLAIADDFDNYWSTAGHLGQRPWKLIKKCSVRLQPGEETRLSFDSQFIFNPAMQAQKATTYYEGQRAIVFRLMGTLSHDAGTPTLVGFSPTQVDIRNQYTQKDYMKEHNVFRKYNAPTYAVDAVVDPIVTEVHGGAPDEFNSGVADA